MTDLEHAYAEFGYLTVRELPSGQLAGLMPMIFTTALCANVDERGIYEHRWCYATFGEAELALKYWDGEGDPLGDWIVQKPQGRQNPRNLKQKDGQL